MQLNDRVDPELDTVKLKHGKPPIVNSVKLNEDVVSTELSVPTTSKEVALPFMLLRNEFEPSCTDGRQTKVPSRLEHEPTEQGFWF